jgi:uncharacterized C2H2 Zn-finger protein
MPAESGEDNEDQNKKTGNKEFNCKVCGKQFSDRLGLARHVRWKHSDVENGAKRAVSSQTKHSPAPAQRKTPCFLCGMTFRFMGVWQGVAMDSPKYCLGLPHPAGGHP